MLWIQNTFIDPLLCFCRGPKKLFCYYWPCHRDLDIALECFRQYFLLIFFDFMSKVLAALHVCCLHLKRRFQSILNSSADPWGRSPLRPPLPRRRQLFSVCCFSPCLLDVRSQLQWLLGGVRLNRTTQSPALCWYSCLPRGLTTAPEERLQRNGSGPWCWPSSPSTSPLDRRGPGSHSWALSLVPVPPVPSYWPLFSSRTLWSSVTSEASPGTDGDMWLESVMRRFTWRCVDDSSRSRWSWRLSAAAGINPGPSGQIPQSPLTSQTQHSGPGPPLCRGSTVDLSHMKESLSHC